MQKTSRILFIFSFFLLICSCKNRHTEIVYYEYTDKVKEQRHFFKDNDTSQYEYTSFYLNGQIKCNGVVIAEKKEYVWKEWYGDGILRREISYVNGEPDIHAENRKLPEIIFDADSLFLNVETKIKVLNIYPNENLPVSMFLKTLYNDSCFDYAIKPQSIDSVYFYYFSPFEFSKIDTIYLKDINNAEQLKLTNEKFKELKKENPDLKIETKNRKMILLKKAAVYENR